MRPNPIRQVSNGRLNSPDRRDESEKPGAPHRPDLRPETHHVRGRSTQRRDARGGFTASSRLGGRQATEA